MNRTIARAFLDEAGNSRVIINGKLQPVRYSHQTVMFPGAQKTFWEYFKYINMQLPENRAMYPEICEKNEETPVCECWEMSGTINCPVHGLVSDDPQITS
jgi:hypothetical protein